MLRWWVSLAVARTEQRTGDGEGVNEPTGCGHEKTPCTPKCEGVEGLLLGQTVRSGASVEHAADRGQRVHRGDVWIVVDDALGVLDDVPSVTVVP